MHKLPIHLFKYDDNQVTLFAASVHEYAIQPSSRTVHLGALPLSLRASHPLNHVAPIWSFVYFIPFGLQNVISISGIGQINFRRDAGIMKQ